MKKTILLLIILVSIFSRSFSQTCSENYTLDWNDYLTLLAGWSSGSTNYSLSETDGNPSSVNVSFNISGDTSILVKGAESPTTINSPFVTGQFYQSEGCLIIATEGSEMQSGESITLTFTFSEPVLNLSFDLFDVDANTAINLGADREEVLKITGLDASNNSVSPILTSSGSNTIFSDSAVGTSQADPNNTSGNVNVTFSSAVKSVSITFSIQNIVGTPSANTEPGFGLHDLSFCTPLIPLPVDIYKFYGYSSSKNNTLFWKTLSEKYNDHFEIYYGQKTTELSKITSIDSKATNGTSQADLNYSYVHNSPKTGNNYYQLHSVDIDGKRNIYNTINLFTPQRAGITILPNPASEFINIEMADVETDFVSTSLTDLTGKLLHQQQNQNIGNRVVSVIDLRMLVTGIYILNISDENGNNIETRKVVIQK